MDGDDRLPPFDEADDVHNDDGDDDAEGGDILQFPGMVGADQPTFDKDAYSTEEIAALSDDALDVGDTNPAEVAVERPDFEHFTEEHYVQSTTREYQDLAESVAEAAAQEHEQSAVAAPMPGLDQGVLGFDDMTGEPDAADADAEELHTIEKAQRSDLFLRVGTGLALIIVFFGALFAGPGWITLFLSALVLMAVNEFYQAVRSVGYSPVSLFGLLGAAGIMYGTWTAGPFSAAGMIAAAALACALWFSVVPRRYPLANVSITVMGLGWIALLASFAIPIFQAGESIALVTALVILTALNDVGAYFVGRAMGSRKLAPVLSPNKTVEGFAGGFVIVLLVGAAMAQLEFFSPLTVQSAVALGVVVSLFGALGDLAESMIKRLLGIKDMGSILPGHGGVLDRIDAFLFAIPAAYLLYGWFGYL